MFIRTDTHVINIEVLRDDRHCIDFINKILLVDETTNITKYNEHVTLKLDNIEIYDDICKHLKMDKITGKIYFPNLSNDNLKWNFIHGCLDSIGTIQFNSSEDPTCTLIMKSKEIMDNIISFINLPCNMKCIKNEWILQYVHTNCIEFISKLYDKSKLLISHSKKYKYFKKMLNSFTEDIPTIYTYKVDKDAIIPTKAHITDVGYDLTIIKVHKKINDYVIMYDTGIRITLSHGYYAEVIARSSIIKSGYMLANNVGIIDPSYTGNIYVVLVKIVPNSPDIELPFTCCQLIVRKQIYTKLEEIRETILDTSRNEGGFGSTNKH
jgi:dUTP pyrophosphatase